MNKLTFLTSVVIIATVCLSCVDRVENSTKQPRSIVKEKNAILPTVCLYTLGTVNSKLRDAMVDSLKNHYPKVRFMGNLDLPKRAITKKLKDHTRYESDSLNNYLSQYGSDSTIVIGLTSADIGLDNFRNRPHWGIMGKAKGINIPVAVFSSYRSKDNAQLFCVMLHEIGHTRGLRHCPDQKCMMQNAKGGNPFRHTQVFCKKCKAYMTKKGWHL